MPREKARRRAKRVPATVRREQILDAAVSVFAQAGFREASTARIAEQLAVSEPTIFRHFATKRELYLATIDRSTDALLASWRKIAGRARSPMAAVFEIGRWHLTELGRDPGPLLLRFRSYAESSDPEVAKRVRGRFLETVVFIEALYTKARAAGEISPTTDVQALTWHFMSVGALMDVTEVLGLRSTFDLSALGGLMRQAEPASGKPKSPPLTGRGAGR